MESGSIRRTQLVSVLPWLASGASAGLFLAAVAPSSTLLVGWLGYIVLGLLGSLTLWAIWRWLAAPKGLIAVVVVAVALRLIIGLGLHISLPLLGYSDSEPHRAGYFYLDAYRRDSDAWLLARSPESLGSAFAEQADSDQYGGLLFISGLIYRTLSPAEHQPMLIVALSALAGGIAVLFTWGFATMAFGVRPASIAGWGVAIYPEAVLLGASQMREPFIIAVFAAGLFGYAHLRTGSTRTGAATIVAALLFGIVISPPYALLMVTVVLIALMWEGQVPRRAVLVGVGALLMLGMLALALTLASWQTGTRVPVAQPFYLLQAWITHGAQFELYKLERGSGFVQLLFSQTPDWMHIPMATGNGLVQPFLPATLMDSTSQVLPRVVGILRALGWFILLPFLIYVPFAATRQLGWRSLQTYLSLVIWVVVIGASYRLAGDQWDNPRARAVLLSAQMALAGWAWFHAKETKSAWLRRTGILIAISTLLFIQWYAGRYYQTPRLSLLTTVAVLAVFVVAFTGGAIVRDVLRARNLTPKSPGV